MKSDFSSTRLGDILSFQRGYDLTRNQMSNGKIPVVGSSNVIGYHNIAKAKAPILLIGRSGTVGRPQFYDIDIWPHNTTLFVTDFHGNDPKFCFYLLKHLNLEDYANSSGVPTLNRNFIHPLKISVPRVPTQRNISRLLGSIDNKIEVNNKINTILEQIARTLYNYWFVQFDFPDENGKPYKSSGGKMVWSEELKREIPELWEARKISNVIEIGSGYSFKSTEYTNEGKYGVVTIKNVQDGNLDSTSIDRIDSVPSGIPDFCMLNPGDILISLTGNVGRLCFVDKENLLLNQRVGKFVGNGDYFHYFYLFFTRVESRMRLENISNGSSQLNLSPIEITKDFFSCPNEVILMKFNKIIEPIFSQIILNKKMNHKMEELRDWLLPMLMNGQVKVIDD